MTIKPKSNEGEQMGHPQDNSLANTIRIAQRAAGSSDLINFIENYLHHIHRRADSSTFMAADLRVIRHFVRGLRRTLEQRNTNS